MNQIFNARLDRGRAELEAVPSLQSKRRNQNPDPLPLARVIVDQQAGMVRWQGIFWQWLDGAYRPMDDDQVRSIVYQSLEKLGDTANAKRVSEILDAMRSVCLLPTETEPPVYFSTQKPLESGLIAVKNGILNLNTAELKPATPDLFTLSALSVDFDPDAQCPKWLEFLGTLWGDDMETAGVMQELLGYLISAQTDMQKVFVLIGPKRAGKGTILRVMTALLGRQNVAAPTLNSLSGNFGLQSLIGKTAALISDARLSGRADQEAIAERLLSISGEDNISIPRKFLSDYTATINARFVMATNEMPRLNDASGALASRFIPLVLTKSFFGNEDRHLTDRLMTELSGILNWSMVGYRRLMERGRFLVPESAQELLMELHELGSPISAFIADRCTVEAGAMVECQEIYQSWREWCAEHGRDHPGNVENFGRDLRAAISGLTVSQPRKHGKRPRYYNGLRLHHKAQQFKC